MRIRSLAVAIVLLSPAALGAQRRLPPLPGQRRGPETPEPTAPPERGPVARQLQYTRMNVSVASYPLLSAVHSSGLASGGSSTWGAAGAGAQVAYRFTRFLAGTLDVTSSFLGGPVDLQTAELGMRFGRPLTERRLEPFADVRGGYAAVSSGQFGSNIDDVGYPLPHGAYGSRYSNGWEGVAGAGVEYAFTRQLSVSTEVLGTHAQMSAHDILSPVARPNYGITSVRWVIGLRYNPVRMVMP
jgi:opacity protein-like surface antigen